MSNELDKHISEQLHRYESAVDAEAIWAAVRPPRRRRPWFWVWLLAGVIAMSGGAWWLMSSGASEDTTASTNQPVPELQVTDSNTEQIGIDQSTTIEESSSSIDLPETNNEAAVSGIPVQESSLTGPASNSDLEQQGQNQITRLQAEENRSAEPISSTQESLVESQMAENAPAEEQNSNHNEQQLNAQITSAEAQIDEVLAATEQIGEEQTSEASASTASQRAFQSIDYRLDTPFGLLAERPFELTKGISAEDYRRGRRKLSPWSVQLDAAYLLMDRELQSEVDSLSNWVSARRTSESLLEAWSTDLSLGYAFHKNWQLRAGLGYTQINTRFGFNTTSTRIDSVDGLQVVIFNPDNTVDSIFGTIEAYETSERELKVHNSFRQWELPILLAYENGFGSLSLIAEAGARIRFSRSWEGRIFDASSEELLTLEDQDWYRSSLGISLQAGVQVGYELTPQLQLRAGGTVRYTPTAFSKADLGFTEGYQLFGLQLGLRYQLR